MLDGRRKEWFHGGARVYNWSRLRWDRDLTTHSGNAEGPGMYWTTDLEEAWSYVSPEDPVVYRATQNPGFRYPPRKPTFAKLVELYVQAPPERQEVFLSDWGYEWPAPEAIVRATLAPYSRQNTFMDAAVTLYHDLFQHNADEYVHALLALGFDGFVIQRGTTGGSRRRDHLVVWNPFALSIDEI